MACDAMLLGRTTYENFAAIWPGRAHPWAARLNAIKKYVDISIHPVFAGSGTSLFRDGQTANMKLVSAVLMRSIAYSLLH